MNPFQNTTNNNKMSKKLLNKIDIYKKGIYKFKIIIEPIANN